jgi:hypothetical protein
VGGGPCGANGGEEERVYVTGKKPVGRRPLGRPKRRWVDNNKKDLEEIG